MSLAAGEDLRPATTHRRLDGLAQRSASVGDHRACDRDALARPPEQWYAGDLGWSGAGSSPPRSLASSTFFSFSSSDPISRCAGAPDMISSTCCAGLATRIGSWKINLHASCASRAARCHRAGSCRSVEQDFPDFRAGSCMIALRFPHKKMGGIFCFYRGWGGAWLCVPYFPSPVLMPTDGSKNKKFWHHIILH